MVGYITESVKTKEGKLRTIRAAEEAEKVSFKEYEICFHKYFMALLQAAKARCPVDTGTLRATIRLEDEKIKTTRIHGEVEREAGFGKVIVAGGLLINPKTGRICDYATFVHDGHFTVTGTFVPPRPFLDEAVKEADRELIKCADKYLAKIGKRWESD